MDLRVLNYFLIVAREENITKASELIHITQPTLSRQLNKLEDEIGVKLFKRGKHNISLTEEGIIFKNRAQEIVNLAEKTKLELKQDNESLIGEISIGCNEIQNMNELSNLIIEFNEVYPLVKFTLRSGNNDEIREKIEQGIVDFGLLIEPVDVSRYNYIRLKSKAEWGILANIKSDISKKEYITARDLINIPLITILDDTIHNELTSWSGEYAEKMIAFTHYNLLSNAATLIKENNAVAVCSKPNCKYDNLKFIPFRPSLKLGALIAWKDNQRFSKASREFIKFLEED